MISYLYLYPLNYIPPPECFSSSVNNIILGNLLTPNSLHVFKFLKPSFPLIIVYSVYTFPKLNYLPNILLNNLNLGLNSLHPLELSQKSTNHGYFISYLSFLPIF